MVVPPVAPVSPEERTKVRRAHKDNEQKPTRGIKPGKVTVNLVEENRRNINVFIKNEQNKSDVQKSGAFRKYGPVEYVFLLEESIILCFLTPDPASEAMEKERHTNHQTRPATCQE